MAGDLCPLCGWQPGLGHRPGSLCGAALKKEGQDRLEAGPSGGWVDRARAAARSIARSRTNRIVSTDDLRAWADQERDYPESKNAWGAVFRGEAWIVASYSPSKHRTNHARRIILWKLQEDA